MAQAVITTPLKSEIRKSGAADQLKQAVAAEAERRSVIRDFVRSQLEQGQDFGTIPVRGKNGLVSQSKPVLFKSGMEKIFSLFKVISTLEKDSETIEMIGKPGVIAYKCTLIQNGEMIAEGRGACDVAERGRINDAIKIAEKRARMDACLSLGFSEYFTQDLEDLYDGNGSEAVQGATPVAVQNDWHDGEIRDIRLTVSRKEMKSSQAGTSYALLHTDYGLIKAWKNTFQNFETGKTYQVAVEASQWNGNTSLAISRFYREVAPGQD